MTQQPSRSRPHAQALPEPTAAALLGLDPQPMMGIVDGVPFGFAPSLLPAAPRPPPPLGPPLPHSLITSGLPLSEAAGPMQDSIDSSDAAAFRSAQFLGGAPGNATRRSGLGSGNVVSRAALFNSQRRGPSARNVVLQLAHNNSSTAGGTCGLLGCM